MALVSSLDPVTHRFYFTEYPWIIHSFSGNGRDHCIQYDAVDDNTRAHCKFLYANYAAQC
eukprot:745895-Hanusia_phi.AAC.1